MFNSGMRESWEGEVAIPEGTSYTVFLLLLVWLYTDSLAPEDVSPEMAIELHTAADMYGVERLKEQCEQILEKGLNVENAAVLLALADENRAAPLKETCMRFIVNNFDRVCKSEAFINLLSRDLILEVLQSR